jgi:predicted protein tyrosine phosphatase
MNNRKHNSTNPHQGSAKRILCVCSAGLLRSPTLAHVLALRGNNTRACGSSKDFALIPIDDVLIHWADEIVFVSDDNYEEVSGDFDLTDKTCVVLDIPDKFERMSPELVKICAVQYKLVTNPKNAKGILE